MEWWTDFNILDLPPCVLLHIFRFLNPEDILSMRKVCQHWHHVSCNGSLWKSLDTRNFGDTFITDGSFCALLHEVENTIECLHFDIRFIAILEYLAERDDVFCPKLKEIYIYNDTELGVESDINITFGLDEKMVKLSRKYTQLKTLGYDELFINTDAVFCGLEEFKCFCRCVTVDTSIEEPTQLKKFLKRHPHLREIQIEFVLCNIEDIFLSMFTDFRHLEKLSIGGILAEDLSPQLQHRYHLSQLQSLAINDLDITDETFNVILKNAPDLRKFDVWYCNEVTDITLECLAKYCHKLEMFGMISHVRKYTDTGLITVATNCPELKEVKVSQFLDSEDPTILSFVLHSPELRVLEVGGAANLTDNTILTMVERCPNIRRLDISRCQKLTVLSISAVLRCLKHLDYLNIADNKTLTCFDLVEAKSEEEAAIRNSEEKTEVNTTMNGKTNEDKTRVLKKMEAKYEVTDMSENGSKKRPLIQDEAELKDEEVEEIKESDRTRKYEGNITKTQNVKTLTQSVERWSALKTLNMSGCSAVTYSCLFNIACFCSNLRKINLSRCENVTDTTVQEFVKKCHFLQMLDISVAVDTDINERERRITDNSLVEIARYCKYLQTLNVEHRDYITAEGVSEVINTCPAIQSVRLTVKRENSSITEDQLIDIAERCKHRFVGISKHGGSLREIIYSRIEIELFNFKPSFSKDWLCCNYDA